MLFSGEGHIMRYSVSAVSQLSMGSYFFCRVDEVLQTEDVAWGGRHIQRPTNKAQEYVSKGGGTVCLSGV